MRTTWTRTKNRPRCSEKCAFLYFIPSFVFFHYPFFILYLLYLSFSILYDACVIYYLLGRRYDTIIMYTCLMRKRRIFASTYYIVRSPTYYDIFLFYFNQVCVCTYYIFCGTWASNQNRIESPCRSNYYIGFLLAIFNTFYSQITCALHVKRI